MVDYPILPRAASALLSAALSAFPVVVFMGARQTGKSTLAQCEPFARRRLYLTLDDLQAHERARLAPEDFLRSAPRLTIDEVQREPQLIRSIKRAVDEDRPRRAGRFLPTGSANLLLMRRVSERGLSRLLGGVRRQQFLTVPRRNALPGLAACNALPSGARCSAGITGVLAK